MQKLLEVSETDHDRVHDFQATTSNQGRYGPRVKKRFAFKKIHLQAPFRGTAHHTSWSLPHFDDVGGGQHTLPHCATSEEGATIVRLLLRRILDSSDDTLSPMAHVKCLPRQNILLSTSSSSKQPCLKEGTRNTVWLRTEGAATEIRTA